MVNDEVTKVRVSGDGSTDYVDFSFAYLQDSDIKVYKIDTSVTPEVATLQVLNTDYTVTAGNPQGGKITFTTAPTVDEDAFVKLDAPYTQTVDIPSAGVFREEAIENGLDKTVLLCQQLREEISRAIQLPETSSIASVSFDTPVDGRALKWRDDGSGNWTAESSASDPDDAATYADAAADSAAAAAASANAASNSASSASSDATDADTARIAAEAAAASVPSMATILATMMPVGFVVTLGVSTNPATLYGFGTWSAIAGKVIVGIDGTQTEFDTLNETGGEKSVTLTAAQSGLPAHSHNVAIYNRDGPGTVASESDGTSFRGYEGTTANSAANASEAHTNLQPYIVKYIWERTA